MKEVVQSERSLLQKYITVAAGVAKFTEVSQPERSMLRKCMTVAFEVPSGSAECVAEGIAEGIDAGMDECAEGTLDVSAGSWSWAW